MIESACAGRERQAVAGQRHVGHDSRPSTHATAGRIVVVAHVQRERLGSRVVRIGTNFQAIIWCTGTLAEQHRAIGKQDQRDHLLVGPHRQHPRARDVRASGNRVKCGGQSFARACHLQLPIDHNCCEYTAIISRLDATGTVVVYGYIENQRVGLGVIAVATRLNTTFVCIHQNEPAICEQGDAHWLGRRSRFEDPRAHNIGRKLGEAGSHRRRISVCASSGCYHRGKRRHINSRQVLNRITVVARRRVGVGDEHLFVRRDA